MSTFELYEGTVKRAEGTFDQVGAYLKHHVADGEYTIVGDTLWFECRRQNGVVEPTADGICATLPSHLVREMKRNRGLRRFGGGE
jgi:hypothetical protein